MATYEMQENQITELVYILPCTMWDKASYYDLKETMDALEADLTNRGIPWNEANIRVYPHDEDIRIQVLI